MHDHLTYSLQTTAGGAFTGPFSIDADDGQIRVSGPLDFEAATSYDVKVVVTDAHGNVASQNVTINLADLNDSNPVFSSGDNCKRQRERGGDAVVYDAARPTPMPASGRSPTASAAPMQALFLDQLEPGR